MLRIYCIFFILLAPEINWVVKMLPVNNSKRYAHSNTKRN